MRSILLLAALALAGSRATFASLSAAQPAADSKIAKNVLESKGEGYCSPSGPIENTLCAYETIETINKDLYPALRSLVQSDFFRYYKVDLFKECPFWYENGFCMNKDCGVMEADESHVPEKWRTAALSEVYLPEDPEALPGCNLHAQDFCYTDSDSSEGQYVDLLLNPERFTGYAGESAHKVWRSIYEENCFGLSERVAPQEGAVWGSGAGVEAGRGAKSSGMGLGGSLQGYGKDMMRGQDRDEECVEKRTYYRIISGLHASISVHICHDYLDQTTGEWKPNLDCFIDRLATHPERLSNIYFDAVLLLRAVARAAPYLAEYDIATSRNNLDTEGISKDLQAKWVMRQVMRLATISGSEAFDEKSLFQGPDAMELRDQFKYNFRNVSRILDCVGCDKCRLWGKLQVSGIGTALKILFELDDRAFDPKLNPNLLQRSEVVALFNALHRISESLAAIETFREMYAETQELEKQRMAQLAADQEASSISAAHAATSAHKAGSRKKKLRKGKAAKPTQETLHSRFISSVQGWLQALGKGCQESYARCVRSISNGPLRALLGAGTVQHSQSDRKEL